MRVRRPNRLPRRLWTPPVRSIFGMVPVPVPTADRTTAKTGHREPTWRRNPPSISHRLTEGASRSARLITPRALEGYRQLTYSAFLGSNPKFICRYWPGNSRGSGGKGDGADDREQRGLVVQLAAGALLDSRFASHLALPGDLEVDHCGALLGRHDRWTPPLLRHLRVQLTEVIREREVARVHRHLAGGAVTGGIRPVRPLRFRPRAAGHHGGRAGDTAGAAGGAGGAGSRGAPAGGPAPPGSRAP